MFPFTAAHRRDTVELNYSPRWSIVHTLSKPLVGSERHVVVWSTWYMDLPCPLRVNKSASHQIATNHIFNTIPLPSSLIRDQSMQVLPNRERRHRWEPVSLKMIVTYFCWWLIVRTADTSRWQLNRLWSWIGCDKCFGVVSKSALG